VLSEQEVRALRQIEQQLAADDPRLAARMSQELPGKPSRWPRKVQNAAIVAVLLSAIVCLAVGAVGAGLTAGLFGGALAWARLFLARGAARLRLREWWRRTGPD
jgi:Protein of unknown function (DUF3040)